MAMGSPLAPILADIFLNSVLDPIICRGEPGEVKLGSFDLTFFTRYVDDLLVGLKDERQALEVKLLLESLHPNLKFKIELECDRSIPFLDIFITRTDDCIITGVYRKPSHSGVLTHYESYVPFRYKLNMLNTLMDRGYKICNKWHTMTDEFTTLTKMLCRNGYTRDFVENMIRKFLDKKFSKSSVQHEECALEGQAQRVEPRVVFCKLPYLEGTSLKVQKTIRGFLRKYDPNGTRLKLVFVDKVTYVEDFFSFKDKGPSVMRNNVVYHLKCDCGAQYIGETERNLIDRMEEHARTSGSGLSAVGEHK